MSDSLPPPEANASLVEKIKHHASLLDFLDDAQQRSQQHRKSLARWLTFGWIVIGFLGVFAFMQHLKINDLKEKNVALEGEVVEVKEFVEGHGHPHTHRRLHYHY